MDLILRNSFRKRALVMKRGAKNGRIMTKTLWPSMWPGGGIKKGHFLNAYMFGGA